MQKEYNRTTEPQPPPTSFLRPSTPHQVLRSTTPQLNYQEARTAPWVQQHLKYYSCLSIDLFLTFCLYQDDHNSNVVVTTAIGNNPHAYLLTFRVALSLSLFTSCYVGPSLSLYSHPFTPLEMATTAIESDFLSLYLHLLTNVYLSLSPYLSPSWSTFLLLATTVMQIRSRKILLLLLY